MKTARIIVIVFICTFSMEATMNATELKGKKNISKVLNIGLEYASHIPVLVRTIKEQVDPAFLNNYQPACTVKIEYQGKIIYVTGTYKQWLLFFNYNVNERIY